MQSDADDIAGATVQVRGVSKRFWGTTALDNVDLDITPASVRALLGQNGAGKSTLIKILAGVYKEDSGEIRLGGADPRQAVPRPLAFIHQDRGLAAGMSVAENIALVRGYPRRTGGMISWHQVVSEARHALALVDLDIDPETDIAELSVAQRSLIAIARALATEARFIVLDEPTAALPANLVSQLIDTIKRLTAQGIGFLYVSHRIDEIFELADCVTALRDGAVVLDAPIAEVSRDDAVIAIVGHRLATASTRTLTLPPQGSGDASVEFSSLVFLGVGPINCAAHRGEILGLVGMTGAGQSETGRALAGALRPAAGSMLLAGTRYQPANTAEALRRGVGFVPGDRLAEGLAADLTVQENLYLNPAVGAHSVLRPRLRSKEFDRSVNALIRYDVRPQDPTTPIGLLSGGNQQKVVVARWIEANLPVLVLEEPTAGVDVGAKSQIHDLLRSGATHGQTVIVISSDFDEIARLCNRALVFNRGQIVAELEGRDLTTIAITAWATGAKRSEIDRLRARHQ